MFTFSLLWRGLASLSLLLTLLLTATGCTQEPPGPIISADRGSSGSTAVNADARPLAAYDQLVWSDEFDASSLDLTKWSYEVRDVWFNNELQATTNSRNNVTLLNGNLQITALQQALNGRTYTSGRIVTKGKQSFTFGRIDVRARLPKGKGLWPAIWMLGANDSQVSWPACGEIDIMELRGSNPRTVLSTMHFGLAPASAQYKGSNYTLPSTVGGDFSTDFHVFSVVRSLNKIEFYVDNVPSYTFTANDASPYAFNNPFYLILNVAVGGDFDGNPDANTTFPQTMQVDYVKFFQYK